MSADLQEILEHLEWNLSHGNVSGALEIVDALADILDIENGSLEHRNC